MVVVQLIGKKEIVLYIAVHVFYIFHCTDLQHNSQWGRVHY
jgi:hypothetical protein